MSISVFDQAKPDGLEKWKQGVRQAPTNPRWSEHDSTIQLIVTQYNTFLKDTPGFRPLDWQLIKAMTWVETGANSPAWKTKPLQIGVSTDPGLGALFSGQEGGDLIVPPGMKLSKAGAQVDYVQNIRAAVGYLLMRMAQFDFKTILDADTTLGHVTVKDGDNLSKIARERGTTVDMLTTMNPKAAASVHKGSRMKLMSMLVLLPLALYAVTASADAVQSERQAREECSDNSQDGMRECLAKKAQASTAELAKAEQRVRAAIAKWDEDAQYLERAKARLDAASKQFAQYRDAQCAFNASLSGGGAGNSNEIRRLACVNELNLTRIVQLQAALLELPQK